MVRAAFFLVLLAPIAGAQPLQPVQVKTVESADFPRGGTVRIGGTAGDLKIEAWDQPRVEATLTRVEYDDSRDADKAKERLVRITLSVKKDGPDIVVQMNAPKRTFLGRWLRGKTNATVSLTVMAPADANLVIRHEDGGVYVYGVGGNIDAHARFGDILLQLPGANRDSIDLRTDMGTVYADNSGTYREPYQIGRKFLSKAGGEGGHSVKAHVDIGGITIVGAQGGSPNPASTPLH